MVTREKGCLIKMKKGTKHTEETKKKVKETMLKRVAEGNQKGLFKKGIIPHNKGKEMPKIQEENHYRWKGGTHKTGRRILKRKGVALTYCRICNDNKNIIIHHIDGNMYNNKRFNQAIICTFCHNAIHGLGVSTRFQEGHQVPIEWRNKIGDANTKPMEVTI